MKLSAFGSNFTQFSAYGRQTQRATKYRKIAVT